MRPLTIFHLNGERGIRGGERQLLYLADYLRRRGHRNIIVCRKDHPLDLETRSHNLDTLYLPFLNEWDPLSAWKLRRELKKFKRPIVHAHTSHAAALAFLAAQGTDAIKVVHRRVDFPVNNSLSLRLKYLSADKIITVSKMIKDIFLQQGIESESIDVAHDSCPQHYIEVVYSGVNPQLIQKREQTKHRQTLAERFHLNSQDIWIGNLAALVPHKNQKTLIEAMPIVTSKIPNVHLLLAGEGPEHKKLIRLRRRLNLDTRVHFLGFQKEPFHILQSLDLFVLASWGEGMGSVLLEAMAAETPIVGTTAGGIPEVVLHNQTGILVPPREPVLLAEAIIKLLQNKEMAQQFVKRGAERLQEFTVEKMGQKIESIYYELLH